MLDIRLEHFVEILTQIGSAVAIFESVEDGNNFVFVDFNKKAEALEQISREDLIGNKVTQVFPNVEKFGLLDVFKRVYQTGQSEVHKISYYQDKRISGWRENQVYKISDKQIVAVYHNRQKHLENLSRWSHVFQNAKWGVVLGNKVLEDMNDTFAQMHGYTRDELIGKPIPTVFAPEVHQHIETHIDQAHKNGHHQFESMHIRKDGTRFPVLLDLTTVKNSEGEVDYRIVNVQDITKQKEAEIERTKHAQELKEILEFLPIPVAIYTQSLEVTFTNKKFIDVLGYNRGDVSTIHDWTKMAFPDPILRREYYALWRDDVNNALAGPEKVCSRIYKVRCKNGEQKHFEVSFKIHHNSRIICFNDLTELIETQKNLEESRARFKLFMDHFPGAAFITDHEKNYFFINKWHTNTIGLPESEILNTPSEKYWPENAKQFLEQDKKVLDTNSPQDFNDIIIHQDKKNHYLTRKFPIPLSNAPTMIGGISLDVTDKYFIEKEKEDMHRQVLHSAKLASIGELAASIGHEIRNPLTIIKGHSENIENSLRDNNLNVDHIRNSIKKQETAINRIATIVNGLKNFARSDADLIETFDVHLAIDETLDLISLIYQKDGVKLDKKYVANRNLYVSGNFGKFQQVIMNLLSNAKYAMRDQHKKNILIETFVKNKFVQIAITDHGEGIDKKNHDQIFDPFFTTKPFGEGTGLGLGIIKSIVEGINGKINFSSKPGKTTFNLTIPLCNAAVNTSKITTTQKYYRLKAKALIVDDEEDIRDILSYYFEEFGITTSEAENGSEALKLLEKQTFDIIITDLKMPVMDGWELLEQLRDNPIKKIIISGNLTNHNETIQVDAYIEKPFDKEQMFKTLSHVLTTR